MNRIPSRIVSPAYALGKKANVSQGVISRFLGGERGLTLATAERLVMALNLHLCNCKTDEAPQVDFDSDEAGEQGVPEMISTEIDIKEDEK
jgi:hypothetical protein